MSRGDEKCDDGGGGGGGGGGGEMMFYAVAAAYHPRNLSSIDDETRRSLVFITVLFGGTIVSNLQDIAIVCDWDAGR